MAAAHKRAAAIITGMPNVRLTTATILLLGGAL